MEKAEAVFAGLVTNIDKPAVMTNTLDQNKITFNASRAWKGIDRNPVYVYSSGSSASCGYEFEEGKEYLVYAHDEEGKLGTGLCTRTALLADATEDLAALGAGEEVASSSIGRGDEENPDFLIGGAILLAVLIGVYYYSLGRNKKNRSIISRK